MLLRAAAKYHDCVTILSDPNDYSIAFNQTANYDEAISNYFRQQNAKDISQLTLCYGYINLLNVLNGWPLVKAVLDLSAAAYFKHLSPAGAAVGLPLDEIEKRMSSFVDWNVLSDIVDVPTAKIFRVSIRWCYCPGYYDQLPNSAITGLIVAAIVHKYTQSNSVSCENIDDWWLRHHPKVITFDFKKITKRAEKSLERALWESQFNTIPEPLTSEERKLHLASLSDAALSLMYSFLFQTISSSSSICVNYVAATSGSMQDQAVIQVADEHRMVLVHTELRLLHH
ncbi:cytidine deaminase-like protein [Gigaspora rosea]|uniref:Cytidine deaminase-like protein n=1 Tax=Gigaspora rosea TaxID=44941 RepID=A0A397V3V5_9GLOM|nr:cytidine deaminase-like protein [Gigaspora rosea]